MEYLNCQKFFEKGKEMRSVKKAARIVAIWFLVTSLLCACENGEQAGEFVEYTTPLAQKNGAAEVESVEIDGLLAARGQITGRAAPAAALTEKVAGREPALTEPAEETPVGTERTAAEPAEEEKTQDENSVAPEPKQDMKEPDEKAQGQ